MHGEILLMRITNFNFQPMMRIREQEITVISREDYFNIIYKQLSRFTDSDKKYRIIIEKTKLVNFGLLVCLALCELFGAVCATVAHTAPNNSHMVRWHCHRTIFFKIKNFLNRRAALKWLLCICSPPCSQMTLHVNLLEKIIDQKHSFFDSVFHFYP